MDAKASLGEPRLLISRGALLHNVRVVRRALRDVAVRVCAIVKADAYGHGARLVADALCNFSSGDIEGPAVDALAVATIDEAAALPVPTPVPVIVFRPLENIYVGRQRQAIELAVRSGWVLTLCSAPAVDDLARLARNCGVRASVQVMVDTGMTRAGVTPEQCAHVLRKIEAAGPSLRLTAVCTHFARAEEADSAFTRVQLLRFQRAIGGGPFDDDGSVTRHAANSAALFLYPQTHLDMVRPGISLYGIDPTGLPSSERPLRPVMKWTAPLLGIQDVRAGVGVGYGQTWRAGRDSRIGLVPVGYADGYPRCLGDDDVAAANGRGAAAMVMIHGRPAPVVGRVSMDSITVDLTDVPHPTVGDTVTLLDNDPVSPASAYALARRAGTIPYEIVSRIGPRVRRIAVEPEDSIDPNEILEADGRV